MNTQTSIQMMQSMKLTGMADAYQAITQMPLDKQPHSHECIATIIDAEQQHRRFKRSNMYIRLSKLRYQANIKDISYQPSRNLNQQTIAALAVATSSEHTISLSQVPLAVANLSSLVHWVIKLVFWDIERCILI